MARIKRTPEEKRERARLYTAAYRKAHHAQTLAAVRAWAKAHPEKTRAGVRKWNAAHREEKRIYNARWTAANRQRCYENGKRWHAANKERAKETERRRRETPRGRMLKLVTTAKSRAKATGIIFEEALRQLLSGAPPANCDCCEIALDYSLVKGRQTNRSPSLDRADNSLGYTLANTQVICLRCNVLKKDASLVDLQRLLAYMLRRAGSGARP